jgi:hypothetical protein
MIDQSIQGRRKSSQKLDQGEHFENVVMQQSQQDLHFP